MSAATNRKDLFTNEECKEILGNFLDSSDKGVLECYNVEQETGPFGYLGEYFHLYLSYRLKENSTILHEKRFFVKTLPYQNAQMCEFMHKSGILLKETTLYSTLLNKLRTLTTHPWCAECYLTRKDLFVMENILDMGFKSANGSDGFLTVYQVKALLKGLAIMHACSVCYEVQQNVVIGEELTDFLYETTVSPSVRWYTAGIEAVTAIALQHPSYQSEEYQQLFKYNLPLHVEEIYQLVNPSDKYRNVFCHRDAWGGNVFFNNAQESTAMVDFQFCRYCPAAIDVVMAAYLNLKHNVRRPIMTELCKHYYDIFAEELSKMSINAQDHMSWQEFSKSLQEIEIFGALYNSISATMLRVPGDYLKSMRENRPEDFFRYSNIDRTEEVLKLIREHEQFREFMYECIDDLVQLMLDAKNMEEKYKIL